MKKYIVLPLLFLLLLAGCDSNSGVTGSAAVSVNQKQIDVNKDGTTTQTINSPKDVDSQYGLASLTIKLPLKWRIDMPSKAVYYFKDDKGENRGSIAYQPYDANFSFRTIRPNHASLLKEEKVDISLGPCSLYTMDADNGTAASGITGTHYDYYAIITMPQKVIYTLQFGINDKKPETKQMFIGVLKSLSFKNTNFAPNYKLAWQSIGRLRYVQGEVISSQQSSGGKIILNLKVEVNYHAGTDPVENADFPFKRGQIARFTLREKPWIDLNKFKKVIVYEGQVTDGKNDFLGADIKYYEMNGNLFDLNGKQIKLPLNDYPQKIE